MPGLKETIIEFKKRNWVSSINKLLSTEFEVTPALLRADSAGLTLEFKVKEASDFSCIGNVLNTRSKLYYVLKSGSDEEAYLKLLNSIQNPTKPREHNFWNYFEVFKGSLINIPAIRFYEKDGGKYLTSSIVIAKVPQSSNFNASIHRVMIVNNKSAVMRIVPRHLYKIHSMNCEKGNDTPIAIVIGAPPSAIIAASTSPPFGVFEIYVARRIDQDLRIAYTPQYNLPIPVPASIVIEGRISAQKKHLEGPFVDLLGLYDRVRKEPLVHVDSIYVNWNEYFHVILPGGMEHKLLQGFPREVAIWDNVRKVVPKVCKVRLSLGSGMWLHAFISIEKNADGDAKSAILAAFAAHPSLKHVVVVDCDIDVDKYEELEWAIATRVQASKDLLIIKYARGSTLDPSTYNDGLTDKIGIDATAPLVNRNKFKRVI